MHEMSVRSFGPIRECHLTLPKLMLLIGPQASGKSTLSKLVFFFLHVRDEVANVLLDGLDQPDTPFDGRDLTKRLRRRFVEFWGPTPQPPDLRIEYRYSSDIALTITLDDQKHKYITPRFSPQATRRIRYLAKSLRERLLSDPGAPSLFATSSALAAERARARLIDEVRHECAQLFSFDKQLLFIPAGRSLLSTLSDQLQYIHPHQLDFPMRLFIERVNGTKAYFDRGLDGLVADRQLLDSEPVWFASIRRAQTFIRRILKGQYVHDREGAKLYVTDKVYTKISYASSGQQEAVWILLSLFVVVLDKVNALIFIEEPEAHLYPSAQKDMVEFIAFIAHTFDCDFFVTTHSPYVLSVFNNLFYAYKLDKAGAPGVAEVVPPHLWLDPDHADGAYISDKGLAPIMSDDLGMYDAEFVDSVSEDINETYDRLLELDSAKVE